MTNATPSLTYAIALGHTFDDVTRDMLFCVDLPHPWGDLVLSEVANRSAPEALLLSPGKKPMLLLP
jgi:hypothetical protein